LNSGVYCFRGLVGFMDGFCCFLVKNLGHFRLPVGSAVLIERKGAEARRLYFAAEIDGNHPTAFSDHLAEISLVPGVVFQVLFQTGGFKLSADKVRSSKAGIEPPPKVRPLMGSTMRW